MVNPSNPTTALKFSYVSASGAARTEVYKDDVLYTTIPPVVAGQTHYISFTGLAAGTTIRVIFRHIYTGNLKSLFTPEVSATTQIPPPPVSRPTNLIATLTLRTNDVDIILSWTNNGRIIHNHTSSRSRTNTLYIFHRISCRHDNTR